MKARKGKITDVAITHLSAIFGEFKGEQWEPVNGDAVFLMVKGGKKDGVTVTGRPSFIAKLQETWKAIFGPVGVDVADDIDNDGDGADDYNGICSLVSNLYYDISAAWGISDAEARSSAVKIAIDNFLDDIDAARSGEDDDSGKGAALVAMGKALGLNVVVEPLIDEVAVEDTVKAMQAFPIDTLDHARRSLAGVQLSFARKAGALGEDGLPQHVAVLDRVLGALREFGKDDAVVLEAVDKADKAPYGNVEYADPGYQSDKKKRYPVDTAAHAKAAWSYINKDSNASKYSSDDLAKVKKKIMAACKKFGIEISNGKGARDNGARLVRRYPPAPTTPSASARRRSKPQPWTSPKRSPMRSPRLKPNPKRRPKPRSKPPSLQRSRKPKPLRRLKPTRCAPKSKRRTRCLAKWLPKRASRPLPDSCRRIRRTAPCAIPPIPMRRTTKLLRR